MLSFFDGRSGPSRRAFLQVGGFSLGAWTLRGQAAGTSASPLATGRSVILLFQHGGPSQFETFDPKMDAPAEIRSVHGAVSTSVPGVSYGGGVPKLAQWAHRVAIVRSFRSGSAAHEIRPVVCRETLNANVGSLLSHVLGANDPTSGMPRNVGLFPKAVDPEETGPITNFGNFEATGDLGLSAAPFLPGEGGQMQDAMRLHLSRQRLDDRRLLLTELDRIQRDLDASGRLDGLDAFQQQAFDVILGGVASAFDLSQEDPRVIARYDTAAYHRPQLWEHKNNRKRYSANAKTLGKLLLLARRLCEAGCTFITLSTDFVWDMHADVNNLGVQKGIDYVCRPFDHAVSAFIEDVENRGLQDRILLVATGEMGRTPKINKNGGRDHWGGLTPLLLYGGGLTHGQVIGQSSPDGGAPASTPVTIPNLLSTVMHTTLDIGRVRLQQGIGREVMRAVTEGKPIDGLG